MTYSWKSYSWGWSKSWGSRDSWGSKKSWGSKWNKSKSDCDWKQSYSDDKCSYTYTKSWSCWDWKYKYCDDKNDKDNDPTDGNEATTINEDAGNVALTNVLLNAADEDGDTVTVVSVEGETVAADGSVTVEGSDGGTFTINADGTASIDIGDEFRSLGDGETATTSVTYTVSDGNGGTDVSTYTVTIVGEDNAPPVAVEDMFMTHEDVAVTGNILDNDSDPDDDPISVLVIEGGEIGEAFEVTTDAGRTGTVTVQSDGSFTFEPGDGFLDLRDGQTDSFELNYTIVEDVAASGEPDSVTVDFEGPNGLKAQVTITVSGGNLVFDVEVLSNGGDIADLRGLFFDVNDESLLPGLSVFGSDVTDSEFDANDVSNLGNGANMKGSALKEAGKFDAGVEIGTQGIGKDDVRTTQFTLDHDSQDLDLSFVADADFGLRLTSVGDAYGSRDDSLKLVSESGDVEINQPQTDTATIKVVVKGKDEPPVATDDELTVCESESGQIDILDNDFDPDGDPFTIISLEPGTGYFGDTPVIGEEFEVLTAQQNRGVVTLNEDGTFTFDPRDGFLVLEEGETDSFELTYTIAETVTTTEARTVSFSDIAGLAAGTVVSDQISGVSISATRNGDSSGTNAAMIFDADNPTGRDWDLGVSGQGNLLIISEDDDSSDPDDAACGGTITFDFDAATTIESLVFVDTEEHSVPTIHLYAEDGSLITSLTGPMTGNREKVTFDINVDDVSRMEVELSGSGAIDDLRFTETVTEFGETDTATITVNVEGKSDPNPTFDLSGTIVTDTEINQSVTFIIDRSVSTFGSNTGVSAPDLSGDGTANLVDEMLSQIVERASSLDAATDVFFILSGERGPVGTLSTTAGAIQSAQANGTLTEFFEPTFNISNGSQSDLDIARALTAAQTAITARLGAFGAGDDQIVVLTSTDSVASIDPVTPITDPSTVVAQLTNSFGMNADIDVVLINPASFAVEDVLESVDADGIEVVGANDSFGLDQLVDDNASISVGDVINVTVGGSTFAVTDIDEETDGFQFILTGIDENPEDGISVGVDVDGLPGIELSFDVPEANVVDLGDNAFFFDLDISPELVGAG